MEHKIVDGRLLLHRAVDEREPILNRLRRIEGQVRGLQQMIGQDRYCPDETQQANAVCAAMRDVIVIVSSQHLAAGAGQVAQGSNTTEVLEDVKAVLRCALRQA